VEFPCQSTTFSIHVCTFNYLLQDEQHNLSSDITGWILGLYSLVQLIMFPVFGKLVSLMLFIYLIIFFLYIYIFSIIIFIIIFFIILTTTDSSCWCSANPSDWSDNMWNISDNIWSTRISPSTRSYRQIYRCDVLSSSFSHAYSTSSRSICLCYGGHDTFDVCIPR